MRFPLIMFMSKVFVYHVCGGTMHVLIMFTSAISLVNIIITYTLWYWLAPISPAIFHANCAPACLRCLGDWGTQHWDQAVGEHDDHCLFGVCVCAHYDPDPGQAHAHADVVDPGGFLCFVFRLLLGVVGQGDLSAVHNAHLLVQFIWLCADGEVIVFLFRWCHLSCISTMQRCYICT